VNSDIVGSGFNSSKMIKPDGVLSNIVSGNILARDLQPLNTR